VRHGHGMASVNQTRPHCVNQVGKTHSKPSAARHGKGTAWARHAMCESAFSKLLTQSANRPQFVTPAAPALLLLGWTPRPVPPQLTAQRPCTTPLELPHSTAPDPVPAVSYFSNGLTVAWRVQCPGHKSLIRCSYRSANHEISDVLDVKTAVSHFAVQAAADRYC
jgi:hypothetical protein